MNSDRLRLALEMPAIQLGVCAEYAAIRPKFDIWLYDELPSTNTQAWALLKKDAAAGTAVIASAQSAGRGQPGRQWLSERGGLYLSLVLEPEWPAAKSAMLGCACAYGIAIALNNLGIPIEVKWPNDLYFKGKKLGGILVETKLTPTSQPSQTAENRDDEAIIRQAVIGVGINWHNPVPPTGVNLAQILRMLPYQFLQNKINCLEVLAVVVLKGILQGVFFYEQVGNQVFVKAYQNLLTQMGEVVSLDSKGFLSLAAPVVAISPRYDADDERHPCSHHKVGNSLADLRVSNLGISQDDTLRGNDSESDHFQTLSTSSTGLESSVGLAISESTNPQGSVSPRSCHRQPEASPETSIETFSVDTPSTSPPCPPDYSLWANRSGKVTGLSEEGYLMVTLHPQTNTQSSTPGSKDTESKGTESLLKSTSQTRSNPSESQECLLFRPNQVHIS